MRCLTLAEILSVSGHRVSFVSREHTGNLNALVETRGYTLNPLPTVQETARVVCQKPQHASWLGCHWREDALQVSSLLTTANVDWLVVDHYGIDVRWCRKLRGCCKRLMVIDDLADRPLDCDLLLDTGPGKNESDYHELIPAGAQLLLGERYALLRDEFRELRQQAQEKRQVIGQVRNVLVTLGGMDQRNLLPGLIETLTSANEKLCVTVVVSSASPNYLRIRETSENHPDVRILSDIEDMASVILDADVAIGAGGVSAYERCSLGLPTITIAIANNQRHFVEQLEIRGAVTHVDLSVLSVEQIVEKLISSAAELDALKAQSRKAMALVDGKGAERVVSMMEKLH